ncbi:MAG: AraC family transcriptional regulator [Spongiibacteraceae bacterium]|nr:AraC family transcriptional regulator [Spongiibacteraceae bacterium]
MYTLLNTSGASINHKTEKEVVPLKYVRTILNVATAQGYDIEKLIGSVDCSFDLLDHSIDPDNKVSARTYSLIYSQVISVLQDEFFGLNLKQKIYPGTFRMLCLTIIHCRTLERAIKRSAEFTEFCRRLSGLPLIETNPLVQLDENTTEYRFLSNDIILKKQPEHRLMQIAHSLAIWRRFCSWLIGKNIELKAVSFQSPEPADKQLLQQMFSCKLHFNQQSNGFHFPSSYLQAQLVQTEESLKDFLRDAPYHLLASKEEDDKSLLAQMKRIVGNDFSRGFPNIAQVSGQLNMSVRTLRRRLNEVGTTYQQFKDNLRCDAAIRYLSRPELKIISVSALLSFDEPSAFHRSFKKWTGMTPGEYRAKHLSQPDNH